MLGVGFSNMVGLRAYQNSGTLLNVHYYTLVSMLR